MRLLRKLTVLAGAAGAVRAYARKNPEKVGKFVDQAAKFVDKRTHGRYHQQIDGAARKLRTMTGGASHPAH
ncbi:antitoxin [Goodfellowiella coeruleoviolacea]|uniref:MT0933-like antitoxin protein n=1 Tax=Goodfellowiella coeruleoviolacea TaxID=334858 RepID=A0AAE3G9X7_9PSEU|nr:antitoxin [Goodfellowiella coeruleoviolacea]MCP2163953.1 MT0933-like antitoxin protein [Goodfellowiella coeruleoviolacea]